MNISEFFKFLYPEPEKPKNKKSPKAESTKEAAEKALKEIFSKNNPNRN